MTFIEPKLDVFLEKLSQLSSDARPLWGKMNAQQMVEHLSDSLDIAVGEKRFKLQTPEDKIDEALKHLNSSDPMPKNFKVNYATPDAPIRNEEIELAIDELAVKWIRYEETFYNDKTLKTLHPVYGELDFEHWQKMHSKHFTHHFKQFGLI